ncbi:MerR family transcriptional regulator [Streptomyces sp. MMS24-I29]|uniref:MerR family transcriptional regulator n=1 Tax=Streptomyces sp. MMS24-I29 TaxID=3351480 RepID=UPI003C7C1D00
MLGLRDQVAQRLLNFDISTNPSRAGPDLLDSELMRIGVFAQRSGLTSSALRFYADSGLLPPAGVDPATGCRYYSAAQVARAAMLRRLRGIAMPLAVVEAGFGAEPDEASGLLDEHVSKIVAEAPTAQQKAAAIKSVLGNVWLFRSRP